MTGSYVPHQGAACSGYAKPPHRNYNAQSPGALKKNLPYTYHNLSQLNPACTMGWFDDTMSTWCQLWYIQTVLGDRNPWLWLVSPSTVTVYHWFSPLMQNTLHRIQQPDHRGQHSLVFPCCFASGQNTIVVCLLRYHKRKERFGIPSQVRVWHLWMRGQALDWW